MLRVKATGTVHFVDGTAVKTPQYIKDIGVMLAIDGKACTDISMRIGKAKAGFTKLLQFWKHSNISTAWKKKVSLATFVPVLLYGMESAALSAADEQKLG